MEILRHHIAGAKWDDAQWNCGSGESLDNVEDGAVAATDKNGIVALRNGGPGLRSGSAVFPGLQDVDRSTRFSKSPEHAVDIPAPCARALQYRIYKEQDLLHGALELRRFFPIGEHDLF
jgi:hypothetical protein